MRSLKYKKARVKSSGEETVQKLQLVSRDGLKKCHIWSERVEELVHVKQVTQISDGVQDS